MRPVTMVFRPRLNHSEFLTMCVFFQAYIVARHIYLGCPRVIHAHYRTAQPELICSSFINGACNIRVVPSTSTDAPPVRSLGPNKW